MNRRNLVATLIIACASMAGGAAGSKGFEPNSAEGKEAYKQARKDIYPKQVRDAPERFANESVAWAGVVKDTQPIESRHGPAVLVFVEHRYFDWIEDHGAQPELFFLSPRGEDEFMIVKKPEKMLTKTEAAQLIPNGTMVVAVGQVDVRFTQDRAKPLALLSRYSQFIDRKMYRADVLDYGRLGEPIRRVSDSEYWKMYGPK